MKTELIWPYYTRRRSSYRLSFILYNKYWKQDVITVFFWAKIVTLRKQFVVYVFQKKWNRVKKKRKILGNEYALRIIDILNTKRVYCTAVRCEYRCVYSGYKENDFISLLEIHFSFKCKLFSYYNMALGFISNNVRHKREKRYIL